MKELKLSILDISECPAYTSCNIPNFHRNEPSQLTFNYSKPAIETPEKGVKNVHG